MGSPANQTAIKAVSSLDQTRALGRVIGRYLPDHAVVLFFGEMAAGKTTLIKSVCEGLGVPPEIVISPTYTLTNIYRGRWSVYHVDLYRLEDSEELDFLDPEDWLNPSGPTLIEWPETARYYLQDLETLKVQFAIDDHDPEKRTISFVSSHGIYKELLTHLSIIELK